MFDGRVPTSLKLADFDSYDTGSPFGPDYVKGQGLKWSEILQFPVGAGHFALRQRRRRLQGGRGDAQRQVHLPDPEGLPEGRPAVQRRLQRPKAPATATASRPLHFSVHQDAARPLNLSHEYLNVWHEASDYSSDQFMFQTGTLIDQRSPGKDTFKVLDRKNKLIWSTPIDKDAWQNFAFTLDFAKKYCLFPPSFPLRSEQKEEWCLASGAGD